MRNALIAVIPVSLIGHVESNLFACVHVVLATKGFFTRKTRPVAEARVKKLLARFKKPKLTSVHPA